MFKLRKFTTVLAVVLLFSQVLSIESGAAKYYHVMTVIQQQKSNWCWAACAEMLAKRYTTTTRTQAYAVYYTNGSFTANVTGTHIDAKNGANYITYFKKEHLAQNSAWTFSSISTRVKTYAEPIIADCGKYEGNTRVGGHMLMVYGVSDDSQVCIADPRYGTSEWITYYALRYTYKDRKYDRTIYIS